MKVRNFWINGFIDGRKTSLAGGPVARDGGFELYILMRERGTREHVCHIIGTADEEGQLRLYVRDADGVLKHYVEGPR